MIEVVTSRNALLYRDALQDMFDLRRHSDGADMLASAGLDSAGKDRFDTDAAIYLLLTQDDGTVIGASRLLPTMQAHRFSDAAPELCAVRGVQRGEKILELTHAFVDEGGLGKADLEKARVRTLVGLFEFCLRAGYEKITWLMPTDLLFRQLLMGLTIKPLGVPVDIAGNRQVPVIVTADAAALAVLRMALHVPEPQVIYAGAPAADLLVLVPEDAAQSPRAAA